MPTSMKISLPESMKSFVDEQVQSGGYGTPSEYIRELVHRDQKKRAAARLEASLLAGVKNGEDIPVTPEFWAALRTKLAGCRSNRKNPR